MGKTRNKWFNLNEAVQASYKLLEEQPLLPVVVPVLVVLWIVERCFFSVSNWVLLALAVWATLQYGSHQRQIIVEHLNKKWMQVTLQTSAVTPLEHCDWLNKLLLEVWPNFINPKLSLQFASIIERRLKHRKSKLIEKVELQEFSLGSRPPLIGLHGTRWATSDDQRIMHLSFDWDADDVSILLFAKLAKPLMGTARIVVNSIHLKGDLLVMPILEGKALAYSFVSTPEIRLGVAFGSGGSQSLPATELPGVSSWLVKIAIDTLNKRMVEPRRQCLPLPAQDFHKKAVGGVLYVTVLHANNLSDYKQPSSCTSKEDNLETFLEIELEELTRRTDVREGYCPKWDSTFNLMLHDNAGILRFHLYKRAPGSVKYDHLTSCEIKMRYVFDDSTIFWAIGTDLSVIAGHADVCGKEIEMTVPFEGVNVGKGEGELTVRLVLKEWHFSDGSHISTTSGVMRSSHHSLSLSGPSNYFSTTGRKICVTVVDGKDLSLKDKIRKSNPYVKLHYGKAIRRTKSVPPSPNPSWHQKFEFDEIGDGEYLKIKCYTEETFNDESIGSARVNLEGLVEGSVRDVYIPLENASSGELRLLIEAIKVDDYDNLKGSQSSSRNGWIELVLIEARDLVAADLRGTSDPYVRVNYGDLKRTTKVIYKTVNPKWHQTLEFPDDGSPLTLHVKDHNTLLPECSIGDCVVDYQILPPNQLADKWIPLQGVKKGEIHIQITRKILELEKKPSSGTRSSPINIHHQTSNQIKEMMMKLRSQVDDNDLEGLTKSLTELEILQDSEDEYIVKLETEQMLLMSKINELGQEIFNSPPALHRAASAPSTK